MNKDNLNAFTVSGYTLKTERVLHVCLIYSIYLYLRWFYVDYIIDVYGYRGHYAAPDQLKFAIGQCIILLAGGLLVLLRCSGFVYAVRAIFILLYLVPNLVLFEYRDLPVGVLASVGWYIAMLFIIADADIKLPIRSLEPKWRTPLLAGLCLCGMVPLVITFGFKVNLRNLLLQDILETRFASRETFGFVTEYLFSWLTKAMLPALFVLGMYRRNIPVLVVTFGCLVYLFLITATKMTFFSVFAIAAFYYFNTYEKKVTALLLSFIAIFGLVTWVDVSYDLYFRGLITMRAFFAPALNNIYFFEFFDDNPIYLSNSIFLSWLVEYPYDTSPYFMIGKLYYGNEMVRANNGLAADAYMNFGYVGVLVYGIVTALIVCLLKNLRLNHIFFGMILLMIFSMISISLTSLVLTHGLAVLIVLGLFVIGNTSSELSSEQPTHAKIPVGPSAPTL